MDSNKDLNLLHIENVFQWFFKDSLDNYGLLASTKAFLIGKPIASYQNKSPKAHQKSK